MYCCKEVVVQCNETQSKTDIPASKVNPKFSDTSLSRVVYPQLTRVAISQCNEQAFNRADVSPPPIPFPVRVPSQMSDLEAE